MTITGRKYLGQGTLVTCGIIALLIGTPFVCEAVSDTIISGYWGSLDSLNLVDKYIKMSLLLGFQLVATGLLWFISGKTTHRRQRLALRFLLVFSLVAGFTGMAHIGFETEGIGVDDANIFFVYAKNLANGHGFVYNVGGERVEGFTSLLWVIIVSLCYRVARADFTLPLLLINIMIVSGGLVALTVFVDRNLDSVSAEKDQKKGLLSYTSILLLVWVFSCPGYIIWTTVTLMETGLWSVLLILACITIMAHAMDQSAGVRSSVRLSVLIAALILTRPEGVAFSMVCLCLFFLIGYLHTRTLKTALARATLPLLALLFTAGGLTAFRYLYFGFPFPNTYYAKISPDILYNLDRGEQYFKRFALSNAFIPMFLIAACWGAVELRKAVVSLAGSRDESVERDAAASIKTVWFSSALIIVLAMMIPIYVGGDHFNSFRFYQPALPLLPLPAICFLFTFKQSVQSTLSERALLRYKHVSILLLAVFFSLSNDTNWLNFISKTRCKHEFRIAEQGRATGEFMNELFESKGLPETAVITAGGLKYTYKGKVFDLMGLNDVEMGHNDGDRIGEKNHACFDKRVFYSRDPLVVIPSVGVLAEDINTAFSRSTEYANYIFRGMLFEGRFNSKYKFAGIRRAGSRQKVYLFAYFERTYLAHLSADKAYDIQLAD